MKYTKEKAQFLNHHSKKRTLQVRNIRDFHLSFVKSAAVNLCSLMGVILVRHRDKDEQEIVEAQAIWRNTETSAIAAFPDRLDKEMAILEGPIRLFDDEWRYREWCINIRISQEQTVELCA